MIFETLNSIQSLFIQLPNLIWWFWSNPMRDFPANAVLFVMQACKAHDDVAFINVGMQVCSRMTDMGHLQTSEKQQTSDTYKHSHNQRQTWLHKTQQNKTRPTRSLKVNKYNSNICMNIAKVKA